MVTRPTTTAVPRGLADSLARVVADGIRSSDRVRALRELGEALWRQHRQVSQLAGRGAELLAAAVDRLPVRDAGALQARYGGDAEQVAEQLVDEAARLAGWLWTAAAATPAPARAVHAVKVIAHSAVEIRLIAELYAVYDPGTAARDPARFNLVVGAWTAGRPLAVGPPVAAGTREIAGKLRRAHTSLADRAGRLARLRHRGRDGAEAVRQLGWRFRRRMRTHPSTWSATRAGEPATASGPPARYLSQAWSHHLDARAAAGSAGPAAQRAVLARLDTALAQQEEHLHRLARRLGHSLLPVANREAATGGPDPLRSAHAYAGLADDAIDLVEEAAARPRRLAGWPVRLRNGLLYAVVAVALAAPVAPLVAGVVAGMGSSGRIMVVVLATAALSPLAYGLGLLVIGRLFRPWLGGRVARSPILGLAVSASVPILTLSTVTVLAVTG